MDKINTDVFKYCPIIDIPNLELYVYTNPIHGDSGIENIDISLDDAERKVCQIVENNPLYRKIIAIRIREYADAIERGEMRGYISDYDGYPAPLHAKIEQIDWNQIKREE
jgi:hypothetical protein